MFPAHVIKTNHDFMLECYHDLLITVGRWCSKGQSGEGEGDKVLMGIRWEKGGGGVKVSFLFRSPD